LPANLLQRAKSFLKSISDTQEIPLFIGVFHHRFHNSPPIVSILSHINPFYALPAYNFNIYFNISSYMPRFGERPISFRFRHQKPVWISVLPITCHVPHQSHRLWCVYSNSMWWAVQIIKLVRWVVSRVGFINSVAATYVKIAGQLGYWSRDWLFTVQYAERKCNYIYSCILKN